MPISCNAVQAEFDRGLALLHSFWYDRSRAVFDDTISREPQCQIAYWGAAMTLNHPLWGPPSASDRKAALAYIARGREASIYSDRESKYFAAVTTLFGNGKAEGKAERDNAYMKKMAENYASFPDDETALFYALSLEGAPGYRKDPKRIEYTGSLLAAVHAHQPKHPGAIHYTIHAYDEPGYEQRALEAAREYAASAPSIPHALHMPSHTFLALGLWDEANKTNRRAFAASEGSVRAANEPDYDRDFHTLWFLIYGDLQSGDVREARHFTQVALTEYEKVIKLYQTMPEEQADDTFDVDELASCLTTYAFETSDFSFARHVTTTGLDGPYLAAQAEASAFAALANHDVSAVKSARARLIGYRRDIGSSWPKAALLMEIAEAEIDGRLAIASGDRASGLAYLRSASYIESQLLPAGIGVPQPIFIPPAHEMLGLQLLRERQDADANQVLSAALLLTPNRPKAVRGRALAVTGCRQTRAACGETTRLTSR
jgi:hypothetical protein